MSTKNKKVNYTLPQYYKSIDDLPILNWELIHKTGDLTHLLCRPPRNKLNTKQLEKLSKVWNNIYDEYISIFGFSQKILSVLNKKREIARYQLKYIETQDDAVLNFVRRKEIELEKIDVKQEKAGDIYDCKITIEEKLGVRLPLKEITVREFYGYLKFVNKKK